MRSLRNSILGVSLFAMGAYFFCRGPTGHPAGEQRGHTPQHPDLRPADSTHQRKKRGRLAGERTFARRLRFAEWQHSLFREQRGQGDDARHEGRVAVRAWPSRTRNSAQRRAWPTATTLVVERGPKPRLLEITKDGKVAVEVPLKPETDNGHMQTRMARKLPNGNYHRTASAGVQS